MAAKSIDQNDSETAQSAPDSGQRIARNAAAITATLLFMRLLSCIVHGCSKCCVVSVNAHQHCEAISPLTSDRIGGGLSGFASRQKPRAYFYWEPRNWEFLPHSAKGHPIAPKAQRFAPKGSRNKIPRHSLVRNRKRIRGAAMEVSISECARTLGRAGGPGIGGRAKSPAKVAAARANGARGGRPKITNKRIEEFATKILTEWREIKKV
jgi:hypothetical protein